MAELNQAKAPSTGRRKFYITNDVLLPEVKRAKQLGRVTEELGKMFILIAEKFARHPSFSGYTFREDMVAFAIANLCANGLKFDTDRFDNPFNYYTTAIYHSFLQYLADEKKQRNIRDMLLIEYGANPSSTMIDAAHDEYAERHYGEGSQNKSAGEDGPPKKSRNYGVGGKTKARINAKKAAQAAAEDATSAEKAASVATTQMEKELEAVKKKVSVLEY